MAKRLHRKEPPVRGIERVFADQIDQALRALSRRALTDRGIHDLRKRLKEARASLRLLRRAVRRKDYRWANHRLRDAARPFAAVRDAKVLLERFDAIAPALGEHRDVVREMRRYLAGEQREARRRALRGGAPRTAKQMIPRARERALRSSNGSGGWPVAAEGLARVYERARSALREARAHPSVDTLHEWRKQTKYLRHGLEVLLPHGSLGGPRRTRLRASGKNGSKSAGARKGGEFATSAHRLTDLLGEDHDLAVLGAQLVTARMSERLQESAVRRLEPLIVARRSRLQRQAFSMGRRFFVKTPAAFERAVHAQWRRWRDGKSG